MDDLITMMLTVILSVCISIGIIEERIKSNAFDYSYSLSCSKDRRSVIIITDDGLRAELKLDDNKTCNEVE